MPESYTDVDRMFPDSDDCQECAVKIKEAREEVSRSQVDIHSIVETSLRIGTAIGIRHTLHHREQGFRLALSTVDGNSSGMLICDTCENVLLDTDRERAGDLEDLLCPHTNTKSVLRYLGLPS